jgi:PKD repeat protein
MRARLVLLSVVTALLAVAAFASSASAAAYCLYPGTCYGVPANVYPATQQGLEDAIAAAEATAGVDDRIEIAADTIDIDSLISLSASNTNELSIEGVGNGNSTLHFTQPSAAGLHFDGIGTGGSGLTNLNVKIDGTTASTRQALYMSGGLLSGVNFDVSSTDNITSEGAVLASGAKCDHCDFKLSNDQSVGLYVAGNATVSGSDFRSGGAGTENTTGLFTSGNSIVNIGTSRFTELRHSITFDGGTVNLRDSVIDMGNNDFAQGVYVSNDNLSDYTLIASLDGVTIVGDGVNQRAVYVGAATDKPAGEHATANITNSLIKMTGDSSSSIVCNDDGNFGVGAVNVKFTFKPSGEPTAGGGCAIADANNSPVAQDAIPASELFVDYDNGDLRLKPGAVVIDAGDTATSQNNRGIDAIGGQRFIQTNGGGAWIDMGGIEYQDYPPEKPSINASATTVNVGQSIDFTAASSDANGDTVTYSWNFGDGGSSTEQNPTHSFTTAGTWPVTVQAHAAGVASDPSDTISITVKPPPIPPGPGGDTATPEPPDTYSLTKPKCKFKSNKKAKNGFTVHAAKIKDCYLQSVSSRAHSYMFRLERTAAGYVVGGTCKAKQGKTGKAKRCDLPLKGSQTIDLPAGTSYLSFGGRWNNKQLPPGTYTLRSGINGINPNGMPNRISMNLTVAKQGSSGRTK